MHAGYNHSGQTAFVAAMYDAEQTKAGSVTAAGRAIAMQWQMHVAWPQ